MRAAPSANPDATLMDRRGFTLVELLTVVAIVGILATISIVRAGYTRERAVRATMLADLKTLVAAQEGFFSHNRDYAGGYAGTDVAGVGGRGRVALAVSGTNTLTIRYRSQRGWSAIVRNTSLRNRPNRCGIFIGPVGYSPNRAVRVEGVPACW